MTFKEEVYQYFIFLVLEKERQLQATLNDLYSAAANETKSTAGDKHETALAMLQIEQANTAAQLQVVQEQKAILQKIDYTLTPIQVTLGSLVKTNFDTYFISTALAKANIQNQLVYAISPNSPLAVLLMGLKVGEGFHLKDKQYKIEEIR